MLSKALVAMTIFLLIATTSAGMAGSPLAGQSTVPGTSPSVAPVTHTATTRQGEGPQNTLLDSMVRAVPGLR
jgi:hypothetical protein